MVDAGGHTPIGPGAEFDLIRRLEARWGTRANGLGDDAAVLTVPDGARLVVSTDSAVDEVHFRRDWLTPEEIGFRVAIAAISDLAAMGAQPLGMLCALVLPPEWLDVVEELGDGVGAAAASALVPIVGGDISRGRVLTIGLTVLGFAATPVRRSGARAGNVVFVTGRLGGPGAALQALARHAVPDAQHRARFARPLARVAEGRWLATHGATAMIDISDGLVSECRHLAAASAVQLVIDIARVPAITGVTPSDASVSGEEYELLVTAPRDLDVRAFERDFGLALTAIGEVREAPAAEALFLERGVVVDLASGYDHFSS